MQRRVPLFSVFAMTAVAASASLLAPAVARAEYAVRGIVTRSLPAAVPADAAALRVAVFGDASGARFEPRLLPNASTAETGAYFAPSGASIVVDWKGWKTLSFPLSAFTLQAEANPDLPATPLGSREIVDRVQLTLTGGSGKIFCDNLEWVGSAASVIDDFDSAKSAWTLTGDYYQRQGTRFGLSQLPAFAKSGGSLQFSLVPTTLGERTINAAPLKALLTRRKATYAVYARPTFTPIYPASTPAASEVQTAATVKMSMCADQIENATFAVFASRAALKNATVKLTQAPLSSSKKIAIQPENIDLHVVKVWNQSGLDGRGETGASYLTPELIVKDDRLPLTGPLPDVPLTGDPITDVPLGESRQFWITVRIPKGQPASLYTGAITMSAPGAKPTVIPLLIDIMPMRLRSPFLQYGVHFRGQLGSGNGGVNNNPLGSGAASGADAAPLSQTLFTRSLEDVRDHGFRFTSLYDSLPALGDALTQYETSGLSAAGPLLVMTSLVNGDNVGDVEKLRNGKPSRGTLDIWYGNADAKTVRKANRRSQLVAFTPMQADYDQGGDSFDVAVYSLAGDAAQKPLSVGRRQNTKRDWWTWSLGLENPTKQRLYTGYFLYNTGLNGPGLYGAFPGFYQHVPGGANPYDETATGADGQARPQLAAYPTANGVLSTVQWEAARAGVNDVRYITNLKTYIRELKDKIREGQIKNGGAATAVVNDAETYLAAVLKKPLLSVAPDYLEGIRMGIASRALKMLGILRLNDATYAD